MHEEQRLAETAMAADLFGPAGLSEDELPPAPEKYTILSCLGRGGGGTVYLARDTHLGRPVALKYLSHARPAEVERFLREARFAARLSDPAIVQVYEAGELDGGLPYIALQYINGGNLASVELDLPATLRVMRQVATALHHAHTAGIVHRDIKPENILLDTEGRAYLTDFGIARDLHQELGSTISQEGQILGTPALMSPEQARGDVQAVDARSDIYSLGATMYVKVTGRAPFRGDGLVDLLHAVIHDEPPFPRRFVADLPRGVEALVLRCMRKRQNERFDSMREIVDAIDRCLSDTESRALSPVWFTAYVRSRIEDAPPATESVQSDRDWAPALDAAQHIAAWDAQLYRVRGDLTRHFPQLDALIARLDRVLEERPDTGWARFYRGVAWFRRGDLKRALEDMERAIDRVRDLAGAYFELGRLYLAIYLDEHHAAQQHFSRVGTAEHLRLAHSRLDQAGIAFEEARRLQQNLPPWQLRYTQAVGRLAEGDFSGCIAACDAILAEDPDLDEVWKLKGDALRGTDRDPLPAYERALESRRSCHEALVSMAEVHMAAGRRADARSCLMRALAIHDGLVSARIMLARTYLLDARTGKSLESARSGLEVAGHALERSPSRYDGAVTVAELQIEMGRRTGDPAWLDRSLDTLDRAKTLDGCQNRVDYLQARARVERASILAAAGGDAAPDLQAVLALKDNEQAKVPDNRPWVELFDQAGRLLEALQRRV